MKNTETKHTQSWRQFFSSSSSNSTTQIDQNTMIKILRHLDVIRSTEGENKINVLIHGYDELLETAKGYT